RLTALPTRQSPSVVFDNVSAEASTANQSGPRSTTERQAPLQAIDAPIGMLSIEYLVSISSRVIDPRGTARTCPRSVMMPVNMTRQLSRAIGKYNGTSRRTDAL